MKRAIGTNSGFTLIEVMIATVVFAVGMMAVITMEFSAISAYVESRDMTGATQVGDRVVAHLEVEAVNWSRSDLVAAANKAVDASSTDISLEPTYATNSPFNGAGLTDSLVERVVASDWNWQVATPTPVDERLTQGLTSAKFCVYIRGGQSPSISLASNGAPVETGAGPTATTSTREISEVVQAQIAVVYPGDGRGFNKNVANTCAATLPGCTTPPLAMLRPQGVDTSLTGDAALPPLDLCGWRAIYMGALIRR